MTEELFRDKINDKVLIGQGAKGDSANSVLANSVVPSPDDKWEEGVSRTGRG